MAGDWLKFEKATPDKPEVFAIASELNIDPDAVVGKLMRVWSWFDSHTENGNAPSVTAALLDRIAGVSGFVQSMQKCGWIVVSSDGVSLPNFDRHCGVTAKQRAQNNKRVSKLRARNADSVTEELQNHVPEKRREEKKREEVKQEHGAAKPRPSKRAPADFKPTDEMLAWAKAKHPFVDALAETESFLDYEYAQAKTDWVAAWRNWIRRSDNGPKFSKKPAPVNQSPRPLL